MSRLLATLGFVAGVVLIALGITFHWRNLPEEDTGPGRRFVKPPKPITSGEFIGDGGQPIAIGTFRGKWLLTSIGYMSCPDVCPTSLAYIAQEYRELGEPKEHLAVAFISVDPERDTPENLKKYVQYFHPDFHGLTGERAAIDAITSQLGAHYQIEKAESKLGYLVSHSADFYLIDPKGRLYARYRTPLAKGQLAEDLKARLKETLQ